MKHQIVLKRLNVSMVLIVKPVITRFVGKEQTLYVMRQIIRYQNNTVQTRLIVHKRMSVEMALTARQVTIRSVGQVMHRYVIR
jgi:hypothetical protein